MSLFIKGISRQGIVTIVYGLIQLITFSLFSRLLDEKVFGYYALLQAIRIIIQFVSEAGIGSSIIQKTIIDKSFYSSALSLSLLFGFLSCIFLLIGSEMICEIIGNYYLNPYIKILSITLLFNSVGSVFRSILYKKYKFVVVGIIDILSHFVSYGIIGVFMAYHGYGVFAFVVAIVSDSIVRSLVPFFIIEEKVRLSYNKKDIRDILGFGGLLTLSRIFMGLYYQVDKFIIGRMMPIEILGIYSRSSDYIRTATVQIGSIYDTVLFPYLSDKKEDMSEIKRLYSVSLYYVSLIGSLISLCFVMYSDIIITIFFGKKWLSSIHLFNILSVSIYINMFSKLLDSFFRSLGLVRFIFLYQLCSVILIVIFTFIGVNYGLIGLGYSVVISSIFLLLFKYYYLCRYIDIGIIGSLRVIGSSLRLFVVIYLGYYIYNIISHNIFILIIINIFTVLMILFFFPDLLGEYYKANFYNKYVKKYFSRT